MSKKLIEFMVSYSMSTYGLSQSDEKSIKSIKSMLLDHIVNAEIDGMNSNTNNLLVNPVDAKKLVLPQYNGNCTTRAIREALRDNIPEDAFRDLYSFVTMVPYSSKLEMLENVIGELQHQDSYIFKKYNSSLSFKEIFFNVFQCYANRILGVEANVPIQNLQAINLISKRMAYFNNKDGIEFLAKVHARNYINAGIIKLNSEKSGAIVDSEATVGNKATQFYLSDAQHQCGYNMVTKRALLDSVFIDNCDSTDLRSKFRDITNRILPENWKGMDWKDISWVTKATIVNDMFRNLAMDSDAYLTEPLLLPVKEKLLQCVNKCYKCDFVKGSPLLPNMVKKIVESWRESCLQDSSIDPLIKAHMAASKPDHDVDAKILANKLPFLDYASVVRNYENIEKTKLGTKIIPKGHVAKIKRELELKVQVDRPIKGR